MMMVVYKVTESRHTIKFYLIVMKWWAGGNFSYFCTIHLPAEKSPNAGDYCESRHDGNIVQRRSDTVLLLLVYDVLILSHDNFLMY